MGDRVSASSLTWNDRAILALACESAEAAQSTAKTFIQTMRNTPARRVCDQLRGLRGSSGPSHSTKNGSFETSSGLVLTCGLKVSDDSLFEIARQYSMLLCTSSRIRRYCRTDCIFLGYATSDRRWGEAILEEVKCIYFFAHCIGHRKDVISDFSARHRLTDTRTHLSHQHDNSELLWVSWSLILSGSGACRRSRMSRAQTRHQHITCTLISYSRQHDNHLPIRDWYNPTSYLGVETMPFSCILLILSVLSFNPGPDTVSHFLSHIVHVPFENTRCFSHHIS